MTETTLKSIPNGGTRLRIMLAVQFFVSVLMVLDLFGQVDGVSFEAWADFTVFNLGIYGGTEAVRKGAEGYMNRGG